MLDVASYPIDENSHEAMVSVLTENQAVKFLLCKIFHGHNVPLQTIRPARLMSMWSDALSAQISCPSYLSVGRRAASPLYSLSVDGC